MCGKKYHYTCSHTTTTTIPCSPFLAPRRKARRTISRYFFPNKEQPKTCKPSLIRIPYLCVACSEKAAAQSAASGARVLAVQKKRERLAAEKLKDRYETLSGLDEMEKAAFRCKTCRFASRFPAEISRSQAENDGLCSARGKKEWDRLKRQNLETMNPSIPTRDSSLGKTITSPVRDRSYAWDPTPRTPVFDRSEIWDPTPKQSVEDLPSVWNPTPPLSPPDSRLTSNISTSGPSNTQSVDQRRPTYYNFTEPGIDFETWNQMQQTGHGRLPPPPTRPLPALPLKINRFKNHNPTIRRCYSIDSLHSGPSPVPTVAIPPLSLTFFNFSFSQSENQANSPRSPALSWHSMKTRFDTNEFQAEFNALVGELEGPWDIEPRPASTSPEPSWLPNWMPRKT